MTKPRILIHVGYPKTGSTWLQEVIFKDETAGFLSPWTLPDRPLCDEALKQFVTPESSGFSAESVRHVFEAGEQQALIQKLIPVMSHEMLVGDHIHYGRFWGEEVAERIYRVFPKAHILIVIREQKSMILSSYKQHIKQAKTLTIKEFIGATKKSTPVCDLNHFKYDILIEKYQNLFAQDNVLVLPFELLKKDQQGFAQKIISFAGANGKPTYSSVAKNVGYEAGRLAIQRYANFLCKPRPKGQAQTSLAWLIACKLSKEFGELLPAGIHERIENHWKEVIAEQVDDYFCESNRKASQLININLYDFGYSF